jgi:hypothetical protein
MFINGRYLLFLRLIFVAKLFALNTKELCSAPQADQVNYINEKVKLPLCLTN